MWFNGIVLGVLDSPLHAVMSGSTMALTFSGRRSGKRYTTPVDYVRETLADGSARYWTLSDREHTWWRNFRGGAPAELLIRRKHVAASGELIEDPALVEAALDHYLILAPRTARFIKVQVTNGVADPAALAEAAQHYVLVGFAHAA